MSDVSATPNTARSTGPKSGAASSTGKRAAPASNSPSRDEEESEDEGSEDEEPPKSFKAMTLAEREAQAREKMMKRLTKPIFRIFNKTYQEEAEKVGATNISKTNGRFYQFPDVMKPEAFLIAEAKFGAPFTVEQVEAHDEERRIAKLAADMGKARLLLNKWDSQTSPQNQHKGPQQKRIPSGPANTTQVQKTNGGPTQKRTRGKRNRGRGGRAPQARS
jgi:hypothetical protein